MIQLAKRMQDFHASIFLNLKEDKIQYEKTTGNKTIDFSIGSPNISPDPVIIETMASAVQKPENYKYAINELPEIKECIQEWYQKRYDVTLKTSEIALLQGSQEALSNLPLVYCNPGDGILVPDPYYPVYVDAPRWAGADVLFMPLKEENDYLIDFDAISQEDRKKAKLMLVCYPNNPTCATAPDFFYEKLIQFAKENDILVIHDNAYSELVFDGKPGKSFLSYPGAKEVGIELNSFSKTYGMAGARLGVLVGNETVVSQYKMLKSNMDYGIFLPVQYAGIEALRRGGKSIESTRSQYQHRRDVMVEWFGKAGWQIKPSPATMFLWASIPESYESSLDFARELLQQTGIVVTPGESFGSQGKRYVRLALVQDEEDIIEAAKRLQASTVLR